MQFKFSKKKILVIVSFVIVLAFLIVFFVLKSNGDNEITLIKTPYIEKLRKKDKDIYNKLEVELIDGEFKGIDVSSWQNEINWEKVSQQEIDYVMIRCAFRSIETDEIKLDNRFEYNIKEANKYGIPVGVYFYSTATTVEEALDEASYVINLIDEYEVTMPIAYDFEIFRQYRAKDVDAKQLNENAIAFMDYVEEHGYKSMIYTNLHSLQYYWDYYEFENRNVWYAQYMVGEDYAKDYFMWQYSDKGRIDGIVGNVDLNESYHMYVKK